jgi:hypothetical protein
LQEGGTEKCIDFVKGKNSNVSLQPTEKAYQYSINRVKDKIEKLSKNRHRPIGCFGIRELFTQPVYIYP